MTGRSITSGCLIAFEGADGVGKTTVLQEVADALRESGHDVLTLREPGGTAASEACREILLSGVEICSRAEALLFAAARAQIADEVIVPSLVAGRTVLVDRWLVSSLAYQGIARGLGTEDVRTINLFALAGVEADRVLLLELSPEGARARRDRRHDERRAADRGSADRRVNDGAARFELDTFQQKVHDAYDVLAEDPTQRIVRVSADGDVATVRNRCLDEIADLLPPRNPQPMPGEREAAAAKVATFAT